MKRIFNAYLNLFKAIIQVFPQVIFNFFHLIGEVIINIITAFFTPLKEMHKFIIEKYGDKAQNGNKKAE